jgi:hydrogenase/urease accessory protein HupE
MRTAYLDVGEQADGSVLLTLRMNTFDPGLSPSLPEECQLKRVTEEVVNNTLAYRARCPRGLAGAAIGVEGLGPVVSEAVVRVALAGGDSVSRVLTREAPRFEIQTGGGALVAAKQYARLGILHILTGADHLLFLLCLVLLVRDLRAILWTETAFTIAHSVSFSATALGLIRVSAPAAEACIALSLVLMASEVLSKHVKEKRRRARGTAAMAFVFGLVHGLGFAGGLAEIGVPERDAATALVSFGVGVEIGQVAFLAVLWGVFSWARKRGPEAVLLRVPAYGVGIAGAAWLFQRLWVCFA